jgi:hypothetical protein
LRDFAGGGAQWHVIRLASRYGDGVAELNPVHLGFNVFRLKSGREFFLPESKNLAISRFGFRTGTEVDLCYLAVLIVF